MKCNAYIIGLYDIGKFTFSVIKVSHLLISNPKEYLVKIMKTLHEMHFEKKSYGDHWQ